MAIASKAIKRKKSSIPFGGVASQVAPRIKPPKIKPPKKTTSSNDLYEMAVNGGLQKQADTILASQKGEEVNKFFSGGFISDFFDVVNASQYGVVGVLKGKSFVDGVRSRSSFTDKDALGDKGIPGLIAGTILDIAFDPLTYIAPATIVKKVPLLSKAFKLGKEALFGKRVVKAIEGTANTFETLDGGSRVGKYLASKFVYMNGADPVFKEGFERSVKNIAVSTQSMVDMVKGINKIDSQVAKNILSKDATGRFIRKPLSEIKDLLKPDELENVSNFYTKLDDLGKEAVDLKLLTKEKYEENIGQYIKNAYTEYELAQKKGLFGSSKIGIKGIKKRVEDLSPEKMAELGQIDNPAYLLFKSSFDLMKDVENGKLLKSVGERFGTNVAQEGFNKIPATAKWGQLAGKYVPQNVSEYLTEIIEPTTKGFGKNLVANFKFFKVIMNPATHARNIVSNKILNYWKLGMNPLDPRVVKSDIEAGREIVRGVGKWVDEAKPFGYNLDTFASAEMKGLLDSPEALGFGKKLGGNWDKVKRTLGNIYQGEENGAKLSAYIFNRKYKNLSPEDAWKAAESATFNYAQVTPFVRKLRESLFGFPFITFTVKSTPVVLETLAKNPARISVIGKIKNSIEKAAGIEETARERASEPAWVRDGFYIKLPIKDKEGRSSYFDMTYILPFGDLISGNFFERPVSMDTGLPESYTQALMNKSPFVQTISALAKNRDFYGNQIWKETDKSETQLKDVMTYLTKVMSPPMLSDQLPGGYDEKGERQYRGILGTIKNPAEKDNVRRNLSQELLRNAGIKIQPIDADVQETYIEWNRKKALEKLLLENGILNRFETTYVPK